MSAWPGYIAWDMTHTPHTAAAQRRERREESTPTPPPTPRPLKVSLSKPGSKEGVHNLFGVSAVEYIYISVCIEIDFRRGYERGWYEQV